MSVQEEINKIYQQWFQIFIDEIGEKEAERVINNKDFPHFLK